MMSVFKIFKDKLNERKKRREWDKKWRKLNKHNFTYLSNSFSENIKIEDIVCVGNGTYGYLNVRWFWDKQERLKIGHYWRLSPNLCKPPIWCKIEAPYWRF